MYSKKYQKNNVLWEKIGIKNLISNGLKLASSYRQGCGYPVSWVERADTAVA